MDIYPFIPKQIIRIKPAEGAANRAVKSIKGSVNKVAPAGGPIRNVIDQGFNFVEKNPLLILGGGAVALYFLL